MPADFAAYRVELEQGLARLGREIPGPMSGFARLHRKATDEGALSSSVKEMMALAISIVVMFFVHQLQLAQERVVLETEDYCDRRLIRRRKRKLRRLMSLS